jgi:hypothetical protein
VARFMCARVPSALKLNAIGVACACAISDGT